MSVMHKGCDVAVQGRALHQLHCEVNHLHFQRHTCLLSLSFILWHDHITLSCMGHDLIAEHEQQAIPKAESTQERSCLEGVLRDVQDSFYVRPFAVRSDAEDVRLHTSSASPASSTRSSIMSMISEVEAPSVSSACAAADCAADSLEAAAGLLAPQHYT